MNHIASDFMRSNGTKYRYQVWEIRQHAFKESAIVFGSPFFEVGKDKRFIKYLLNRNFRVYAPDFRFFGQSTDGRKGIDEMVDAAEDFCGFVKKTDGLPIVLMSLSVSAPLALRLVADRCPEVSSVAFIAPVFGLGMTNLSVPRFFLKTRAALKVEKEDLIGREDDPTGATPPFALESSFSKRAVKEIRKDASTTKDRLVEAAEKCSIGIFAGDGDPFSESALVDGLANEPGIKTYAHLRSKHLIMHDRHADNFYRNLGIFLDEVEAKKQDPAV